MTKTKSLVLQSLTKFLLGIFMMGVLLFLPAGSLAYWNAWVMIGVLFIPMFIMGVVLLATNQELLQKRLNAKENEREQKIVVALSGVVFIASFIVAGLSWRYGWYMFPQWVVYVAAVLFVCGYIMYAEVLRENSYLSRTIEVQSGQQVVSTGLYGIVRHPMYTATIILFVMMPIILGAPLALLIMLLYLPLIVSRIKNEEALLDAELPGYTEYKRQVKYRLIPFVW